ncbi:MAG: transposase [Mesorhizobium sp.]|uniref:IS66 family insertion sequence element accessory protein TnpB n=1 Tax=Mesorhizobium sp. TaxID=1871066 RepID=UPI000FE5EC04|nr:MAG: transposase [Mesorhizobium sp.]TIU10281.1 MAG: IS66 family insertion sequence element accessory protein TnpB [Mesorhizobium sp.]TIV76701.1 MAG: IS66 family insertion sequence element accessory protein TnpB [Mesorhizobium sp.]
MRSRSWWRRSHWTSARARRGWRRETTGADPFSGTVYVFRAKRTDRIKLIFWDGTGVCLYAKRLEDGEFRWPKVQDGVMRHASHGDYMVKCDFPPSQFRSKV